MLLLVFLDPQLVAVTIRRPETVERDTASGTGSHAEYVVGRRRIGLFFRAAIEAGKGDVLVKLLPWAQSSAMACVNDDAKTLVSRDTNIEANEEEREGEEPPPP